MYLILYNTATIFVIKLLVHTTGGVAVWGFFGGFGFFFLEEGVTLKPQKIPVQIMSLA